MARDIPNAPLRALVVDDEPGIRRLLAAALSKEGFQCELASDGDKAAHQVATSHFDLVVTDLAMPHRNGHSLVVELLAMADRPVVAVVTGVLEPRLARDMIARGIDDIVFKPLEFLPLAAKLRSLVDRRLTSTTTTTNEVAVQFRSYESTPIEVPRKVLSAEVAARVREMSTLPPVSQAAFDVYTLAANLDSNAQQVAAAVQREPALVTDILKFANSAFFNPAGFQITDVGAAVARLGQRRVGGLALATATSAAVAQESVPFIPLRPIWRRCLAAGICMEMLLEQFLNRGMYEGLFITAVLHPMGRILVAAMFPNEYAQMLVRSDSEDTSLWEQEQQFLPESTGAIAAGALSSWDIPDEIVRPLRYACQPFQYIAGLPESLRCRVELVKTAAFIGEVAAGHYERWDLIDVPPAAVLRRLKVQSIESLVEQCRHDLESIAEWNWDIAGKPAGFNAVVPQTVTSSIGYRCLGQAQADLIPHVLACGGVQLTSAGDTGSEGESRALVNSLDIPLQQALVLLRDPIAPQITLLAGREHADRLGRFGSVLTLPCSFGALRDACGAGSIDGMQTVAVDAAN